jgi:hypothetical protein
MAPQFPIVLVETLSSSETVPIKDGETETTSNVQHDADFRERRWRSFPSESRIIRSRLPKHNQLRKFIFCYAMLVAKFNVEPSLLLIVHALLYTLHSTSYSIHNHYYRYSLFTARHSNTLGVV